MIIEEKYGIIRPLMKPGDIIAFGGKGLISDIIKKVTRSCVSHVAIVMQTNMVGDNERYFNNIIESTMDEGVSVKRLSEKIIRYNGDIWWLPLNNKIREQFNNTDFFNFVFNQIGKKYDKLQAIESAEDLIIDTKEDFSKFFCSELDAGGLEASGIISDINCSEVTPIDLCRWNIYKRNYYQLKGNTKEISRFNSISPDIWSTKK